jgi:hypothetical protein
MSRNLNDIVCYVHEFGFCTNFFFSISKQRKRYSKKKVAVYKRCKCQPQHVTIFSLSAVKAKRKTTAAAAAAAKKETEQLEQLRANLLAGLESHCRRLPAQLTPVSGLDCRLELFLSTAASLAASLSEVVEFAKRLPGFLLLPSLTQLDLVKANSLKILLLCDLLLDGNFMTEMSSSTETTPTTNNNMLMTFFDGKYLSVAQAEALFSRDFVSDYSRLKAHCTSQVGAGLITPTIVALLAAGLLLELPPKATPDGRCDLTALRQLSVQVSAAAAVAEPAPMAAATSEVLSGVGKAAQEMRDFFTIFQSFCDNRQLPPVFVEVFDF